MGRDDRTRSDRSRTRVLVPVRVLEGEAPSPGLVDLLAAAEVILLGYHVVPEQTAPSQARLSFEDRAVGKLDEIEESFVEAGAVVERTLAFTHDAEQTIERVATDEDCAAIAHLGPASDCGRVLLVLHGDVDARRIGDVVADLVGGRGIDVGVLEVSGSGEGTEQAVRAVGALEDGGVEPDRIQEMAIATEMPVRDIALAADDFDATVLGEREPSLAELLLGDFGERVAAASLGPAVVVRRLDEGTDV